MQPNELMDGPSKIAVSALVEALEGALRQEFTAKAVDILNHYLVQVDQARREVLERQNSLQERLFGALSEISRMNETEQRIIAEEMGTLEETAQRALTEKARLEKRLDDLESANVAASERLSAIQDTAVSAERQRDAALAENEGLKMHLSDCEGRLLACEERRAAAQAQAEDLLREKSQLEQRLSQIQESWEQFSAQR